MPDYHLVHIRPATHRRSTKLQLQLGAAAGHTVSKLDMYEVAIHLLNANLRSAGPGQLAERWQSLMDELTAAGKAAG